MAKKKLVLCVFISAIIFALAALGDPFIAAESSFKSCKNKPLLNKNCNKDFSASFSGTSNILDLEKAEKILNFQKKVKDMVHTKIELKLFEIEMFEACANDDTNWFREKNIKRDMTAICSQQIEQIRSSIRERFPLMRRHLALSAVSHFDEALSNDQSGWYKNNITHGLFRDFSTLKPLGKAETHQVRQDFLDEISLKILSAEEKKKGFVTTSSFNFSVKNVSDILTKGRKASPAKSDREILIEFMSDKNNSYHFRNTKSMEEDLHKAHKDEYYKILNQLPLIGYIDDVDIQDPHSPSNKNIATALSKTKEKLSTYFSKLKETDQNGNEINWDEYSPFTQDIEKVLKKNPEFCEAAETLLKENTRQKSSEIHEELAIATLAAVPCFFGGPVTAAICIGGGLGLGAENLSTALATNTNAEVKNFTDFLGEDQYADFQSLEQINKDVVTQTVLLPLAVFGTLGTEGRAVGKVVGKTVSNSYHAYDKAGDFITKSEGLEMANKAMEKLVANKNFEKLSNAERAKEFDKILAGQILPKHLFSFLENKKGGFKLIDTNYDFDQFPPDLLEKLSIKLGGPEKALYLRR
jgi:hypothetical protein